MLSQREILQESFWDGIKDVGKVARGAVRATSDIARTIAPKTTGALDDIDAWRWKIANSYKRGYEGTPSNQELAAGAKDKLSTKVADSIVNGINLGLSQRKIHIIPRYGVEPAGVDPNNGNKLYKIKVITPKNKKGEWMIVDKKGNSH